jgi:hypothetical protein
MVHKGGEPMSEEPTVKRVLEEEINVSFNIQLYKIIIERGIGSNDEYYKWYFTIKTPDEEIKYDQILTPFTVDGVLREIKKLHEVYKFAGNEKLAQGAREEILKLIAQLLWTLG